MANHIKPDCRGFAVPNKPSIAILLVILFLAFFPAGIIQAESIPPLTHKLTAIHKPVIAPALRFENMDEEIVDIKDFRGKVVVVNFWATWCPPCRREMGSLERLHLAMKGKNVVILAVNIGEDIDTVFPFLGLIDPSPSFTMLFDSRGDSMKSWNVLGLPTTYVIKPDGTMAYRAIGGREFDHPDIQQAISKLVTSD